LALFAIGLPDLVDAPTVGRVQASTLMLLGGLLTGVLLSVVFRPVILVAARRRGRQAESRLTSAVGQVGQELILNPVRDVQQAYEAASRALHAATR
jgi:hypothetical protein